MSGKYVGRLETLYVILRRLLCVCTPLDWMALLLIQIDELEQIFDEVALVGEKLSFCQRISQNDYNI